MYTVSHWHCSSGHVFSVFGQARDHARVTVQACPHSDTHVGYEDGTSPDTVTGPFLDEASAREAMMLRLAGRRFRRADQEILFQPTGLEDGSVAVIEAVFSPGGLQTTLHQYDTEDRWESHLRAKGAWLLTQGYEEVR